MKRNTVARVTLLITTVLLATCTTTAAVPVSDEPDVRAHHSTHRPINNQYVTSQTSDLSDQYHTRDVPPNAVKQYKSSHQPREMHAADLKRAARQSRQQRQTSRQQPSNANSWLNSFSKLFGIAVNEQHTHADDDSVLETTHHTDTHRHHQPHHHRSDLDAHHPADFGSEEEMHTWLVQPEPPLAKHSKPTIVDDDDERLSETDLRDLVRLFRRMFTTLENDLNQTEAAAQSPPQSSASNDLNSALAQAQQLNRRKEAERNKVLLQTGDDELEQEGEDADEQHDDDHPSEFPVGSPAYESRKRIMRGLNGVVESERPLRRRVTPRYYTRVIADDREHLSQAMSAGVLPYL